MSPSPDDPPAISAVPVLGDPAGAGEWIGAWRGDPPAFVTRLPADDPGRPPAVIVAVERFPEEWPAARVRELLGAWPLSAWVVAVGPWAAGGGRTGSPWPAPLRCSFAESRRRVAAALRGDRVPAATDSPERVYLEPAREPGGGVAPLARASGSRGGPWDPAAVQSAASSS